MKARLQNRTGPGFYPQAPPPPVGGTPHTYFVLLAAVLPLESGHRNLKSEQSITGQAERLSDLLAAPLATRRSVRTTIGHRVFPLLASPSFSATSQPP